MKALRSHLLRALLVFAVLASPALLAQQAAAPAPAAATFSQQDLDQLLAPIALYPDALVAQVLLGSTFPLEVVEAARWSKANPKVKDKALEDAMLKQKWDPAVKALTAVPQVLAQMNEKLDWTQKLGAAFIAQQADVMKTVQALRSKAVAAGNLKSTPEQVVKTEVVESKTIYIIESAKPTVVYVPTYNPYTVYGTWWYPAPPYYMYPPAYVYPPGVGFATGVVVGAAIWGNTNWNNNNVNINVNQYNSYNKTNISNTNAQQQYNRNQANQQYNQNQASQQYNKNQASQQYNQGQASQQYNKNQAQGAAQAQGQAQARSTGASSSAASSASSRSGSSSGFSGAGTSSRASTQQASARGGASRGGGGGGRR